MQRVTVQVPMTRELKDQAEIISAGLGFSSLQETIRVLLTKLAKKEFNLKVEETHEQPSPYLLAAMKKAKANRKAGKASPIFDNAEDALKFLDEQGI